MLLYSKLEVFYIRLYSESSCGNYIMARHASDLHLTQSAQPCPASTFCTVNPAPV